MQRVLSSLATALAVALIGCDNAPPAASDTTATDVLEADESFSSLAGTQPSHFVTKGAFAELSFSSGAEGEPQLFGYLQVVRGGTAENQETFLYYDITRCDPFTGDCLTLEGGSGLIRNKGLIVRGHELTLRTNTSAEANPAFERYAGDGGAINVQWTQTQAFVSSDQGKSRLRFRGLYRFQSHYDRTSHSALIQATIFGNAYPGAIGFMGVEHSGVIEMIKE